MYILLLYNVLSPTCFGSEKAIIREKNKEIYTRIRSLCTDKCYVAVLYIDEEGLTALFGVILHLYRPIRPHVLCLTDDGSILTEVC
jgi:hypothetical protein